MLYRGQLQVTRNEQTDSAKLLIGTRDTIVIAEGKGPFDFRVGYAPNASETTVIPKKGNLTLIERTPNLANAVVRLREGTSSYRIFRFSSRPSNAARPKRSRS